MAPPLLYLQDIHLTFGGQPLLSGADLSVSEGERLCLVGRNGSGKSTLLKIAAGIIQADSGERFAQPGATIRYLPQEPDLSGHATTLAYVEAGLMPGDDPHRARLILEQLGLTGVEQPGTLSGGEVRRAALARILAPEPDILLLDEPTNHLDLPAIEWLESILKTMRSAIVMISHDRRFLETLSRATGWLDRGQTRRLEQGFGKFEEWRDEVLEQEELERHKIDRKLVREADWLRHGVSGRRKRNQRRLGALYALRQERKEQIKTVGNVTLQASAGPMSGKVVIEAKDINKSFDDRPIVRDVSTRILRGDRLGVVGSNGAGKTTLLSLLTGKLLPDSGVVKVGASVEMASLDQQRKSLDPTSTLSQVLTGGHGDKVVIDGQTRHVASYMKDFLFAPEQAHTPVGALSGGERGRLMLARALSLPSNLLVLDEPTNDLDLETLDLLQEMLNDYAGTVLLVSHDRDFLDRVATSVIVAQGDGRWTEYAGGYSDMIAQRGPGVTARSGVKKEKIAAEPKVKPQAEKARPSKLSFKEKHDLDTLPAKMTSLQSRIKTLQEKLAGSGFYKRDPAGFAAASTELATAEAELAASEERWLMLEMRREELEG